jgi:hypothetical protein
VLDLFLADELRASEDARLAAEERAGTAERGETAARASLAQREDHIRDLEESLRLHAKELSELREFRRRIAESLPARAVRAVRRGRARG